MGPRYLLSGSKIGTMIVSGVVVGQAAPQRRRGTDLIEPFGLSRLWLLKKLERRGTPFGMQRMLTRPISPFWRALSSYISIYEPDIHTFVIRGSTGDGRMSGAAQFCNCSGRPEAEIIFMAPSLSAHPEARSVWSQLLSQVCKQVGKQGLQRLFASVPWDGEEMEVFREAGFITYAREEILRLDEISNIRRKFPLDGLRRLRDGDKCRLLELYVTVTPRRVQWAEGQNPPLSWLRVSSRTTFRGEEVYVCEKKEQATVSGLLHIMPGKTGHWLEIACFPDNGADVDDLLDFGLERISNWTSRPIYTAVREYQGGVLPALYARGFESCALQAAMVKNTAVWTKDPLQDMLPVVKKGVEPSAPIVTLLNGEVISDGPSQPVAAIVGFPHD